MPTPFLRAFGRRAEDCAISFFLSRGFSLVDRNWQCRSGELDVIVRRGERLHFIEVKARASASQHPFEAIPKKKRQRLERAVELWLTRHPECSSSAYQIDAFCLWREGVFGSWQFAWLEGI